MTQYACLLLPMPPSLNGLFANAGKRRVKSRRYQDWIFQADLALTKQRPLPVITGDVSVTIALGPRPKGRADLDNKAKAALDRLVKWGVIEDDKHVSRLVLYWDAEVTGARIEVQSAA